MYVDFPKFSFFFQNGKWFGKEFGILIWKKKKKILENNQSLAYRHLHREIAGEKSALVMLTRHIHLRTPINVESLIMSVPPQVCLY
jgi:hypothetical protein